MLSDRPYVLDEEGLATWSDIHADAWTGLLETHKRLTRQLDAELEAAYGITLSALDVLGWLAGSTGQSLRLSALANSCGLSLSRISRIVDSLEARGLVERRAVAGDARAVAAHLTDGGLELARRARRGHFESVRRRFFEQLSGEEIASLGAIFSRFIPRARGARTEPAHPTEARTQPAHPTEPETEPTHPTP